MINLPDSAAHYAYLRGLAFGRANPNASERKVDMAAIEEESDECECAFLEGAETAQVELDWA